MVLLEAGQRYRLDLILKDMNSNYLGSMTYGLPVPQLEGEGLQASSIILANTVSPIPPTYDRLEQFVIGDMKIQPNVRSEYAKGQMLIPYLQVYNVALDQSTLEPSLQISYAVRSGDQVVQNPRRPDRKERATHFRATDHHCRCDTDRQSGARQIHAGDQRSGQGREQIAGGGDRLSCDRSAFSPIAAATFLEANAAAYNHLLLQDPSSFQVIRSGSGQGATADPRWTW